uniref:Thrombospondin, type I, domain containing 1 n=1 Tax=Sander lucioperca TaxID=283035 RepID=A0A8C9ZBC4_SANLU
RYTNLFLFALSDFCASFPVAFAGLSIWPSFHVALSNASVFVEFSTRSNSSTIRNTSLSLVNTETNTTLLTRTLPNNQSAGRVEFNCSCFLYAGTFRFLLRQTSISTFSRANGTHDSSTESTSWWWSSELQVQWPTFHIAVDRAGNHSGSFQVGISTNEHFQPCSSGIDSALFLEVSYMEYNQIGRNSIDKVQARTRHPIKPLRSQSVELSCAFPFTERDFIRVALRSPHSEQDVKSSGPLYLSRIFSYKLLVENTHAYRSGTAVMEFGPDEPSSPLLAFNWLTQGENETEFNCSVFYPGRNKYCFRFVFNFSRSPKLMLVHLLIYLQFNIFLPICFSAESWGPWLPWSVCSVSCGEGMRERVRECLLPSGVGGMQCTGMVKEQSLCSLEDCAVLPVPSPSLPPVAVRVVPLGGNMVVVAGISLCLAVILATVVVTLWRKLCKTPQCSSVRRGSMHSPGGRKLSDEASICGHSLQRPSLSDGHDRPFLGSQPLSQTLLIPLSQDPERLSPTGQKMLPPIFGYRLAQQQLKEMKKKGLKEATQLYHVSSSPVHDTVVETSASPTNSPIPDDANHNHFCIAEPPSQTSRVTPDRLSPRVELVLGPSVSAHASGGSSKWRDRTADWVEMVERSGLAGFRGGGDAGMENSYHKNPNFRRTSSFNDTKPQPLSSVHSRQFRERSMTQVTYPPLFMCSQDGRGSHTALAPFQSTGPQSGLNPDHREMTRGRIGGPATGPASLSVDRAQRAEQNWNRRGPSPIQRNILARKLKEAQSCSGVKGRQRSSTFSVSPLEQRKSLCHSLPMSGGCSSSGGSPYRLSEAEQRMLDLDLSSAYVGEEE